MWLCHRGEIQFVDAHVSMLVHVCIQVHVIIVFCTANELNDYGASVECMYGVRFFFFLM